jgi:PTH1 family peptidyl-tRNA hydrolase
MNESARALKLVIDDERLSLNQWNVVVVYDDFETNLGTVKLAEFKKNESHNGIKSIKNFVASLNVDCSVFKLGIGIGPKPTNSTKESMATWVLSPFSQTELQLLQSTSFPTLYVYIHTIEDSAIINVNKLNATVTRLIQDS